LIIDVLPDSPAAKAGLRPTRRDESGDLDRGDAITAIDGRAIHKVSDLYDALEPHAVGDTVTLTLRRQNDELEKMPVTLQAIR